MLYPYKDNNVTTFIFRTVGTEGQKGRPPPSPYFGRNIIKTSKGLWSLLPSGFSDLPKALTARFAFYIQFSYLFIFERRKKSSKLNNKHIMFLWVATKRFLEGFFAYKTAACYFDVNRQISQTWPKGADFLYWFL